MKTLATTLTALAISATAANAATFGEFKFDNGSYAVVLEGDFTPGTARAFTSKIEEMYSAKKTVQGVFLNSQGGLITEGVMVANAIGNYNLQTYVLPNEYCASACFLAFAAGDQKLADANARIGVHSAKNGKGEVNKYSIDATRTMSRVAAKLGVSPDIVDRIQNTPPDQISWLSNDDLKMMGVTVEDFAAQVTAENKDKKQYVASQTTDQKNAEWDRYSNWAIKESARQNNGQANITNKCGSAHCETHLIYIDKSNRLTGIIVSKELDKKTIISRQVCRSTDPQGLKRTCTNWDSGEVLKQEYRDSTKTWVSE